MEALQPYNVEVRHPDQFLSDLFGQNPDAVVQAARRQATALRNPPMTLDQVLDALAIHVPGVVARIRAIPQTDDAQGYVTEGR